ncbi:MAG: hypothetical protein ACM35G_04095 [Planctomycetaceae bacterium]
MSRGRGIRPLAEFPQKTPESPQQLEETGGPIVLTINGEAEEVVQDAESYQKLFKLAEGARTGGHPAGTGGYKGREEPTRR